MKILENVLKAKLNVNISYLALEAYVDKYLYKKYDREACLFYLSKKTDKLIIFGQKYTILAPTIIADLLSLLPQNSKTNIISQSIKLKNMTK